LGVLVDVVTVTQRLQPSKCALFLVKYPLGHFDNSFVAVLAVVGVGLESDPLPFLLPLLLV
jgi:hypothetical protein